MSASAQPTLPKPLASGVPGEATTFYFDRDFGRNAVKLMPGEFFVTKDDIVISTVLGSCVAACLCDRTAKVGGMNHFMLPRSDVGDGALTAASGRYGAFAMERLINELLKHGARKSNLEAKVFGGGAVLSNFSTINVGERNAAFVLDFLKTEGIRLVSQDLLDVHPRRVAFFPINGRAMCKRLTKTDDALVAAEQQYTAKINMTQVAGEIELF